MTDVSNRDDQPVTFQTADFDRLAIDGIIKVTRIFTINRHQWHIAQINTLFQIGHHHFGRQFRCHLLSSIGKDMRHAVFTHSDFDFHAGIIDITQHFSDSAHRLGIARWLLSQFNTDHLTGLGLAGFTSELNIMADAFILRHYQPDTIFIDQSANHMGVGARQHFNNGAFGTTAPVYARHAYLHTVTIHDLLHFFFGQEDILALIRNQEAIPITMCRNTAHGEAGGIGQLYAALGIRFQLTVALHGRQTACQPIQFGFLDGQGFGKGGEGQWPCFVTKKAEYLFAAGYAVGELAQKS